MPFQRLLQEPQSCRFVTFLCDIALENFALVIDSAPQIVRLAIDVRYAALRVTKTSSTCQRQWRKPFILEIRWRLISAANIGPNLFHQNLTVSWQMSMPRSQSKSSTFRRDKGKRTYIITTSRMTSGDELKRLNGLAGFRRLGINPPYPRYLNLQQVQLG